MKFVTLDNTKITPSKIVCVGRNYVEHIYELGNEIPENMVLFNKPNSSISNELSFISPDTRFEGEICFVIKNNQIDGIGFGLDLTKADTQQYLKSKGLPWERAKAFDKSAVFDKFIKFDGDLSHIWFELFVNGKLAQTANYDLMIYKPKEIVEEISTFMTLEDGDIIMTGTPKGVATYAKGDEFVAKVYHLDKIILESKWQVN